MLSLSPLAVPGVLQGGIRGPSSSLGWRTSLGPRGLGGVGDLGESPTMDLGFGRVLQAKAIHVSSGWGTDERHHTTENHPGIDMPTAVGTPVLAAQAGKVVRVNQDPSNDAGRYITLSHDRGWFTRYLHLSKPLVSVGDVVTKGQVIAKSGNTGNTAGPHLHFDMWLDPELLGQIEAIVGRPTTGYPVDLGGRKAVPAEPWIPVDSYDPGVVTRDRARNVPLYWDLHRNIPAEEEAGAGFAGIGAVITVASILALGAAASYLAHLILTGRLGSPLNVHPRR